MNQEKQKSKITKWLKGLYLNVGVLLGFAGLCLSIWNSGAADRENRKYNDNFDEMISVSIENVYFTTNDLPVEVENLNDYIKDKKVFDKFDNNKQKAYSLHPDRPAVATSMGTENILKLIIESQKIIDAIDISKLDKKRLTSYISYSSFIRMQSDQAEKIINQIDNIDKEHLDSYLINFKAETIVGLSICLEELEKDGSISSKLYSLKEQILFDRTDREIAKKIGGL